MKETMMPSISQVLLSLILCVFLQEPIQAIKQPYIVYLGSHSFGPNPSAAAIESVTNLHYNLLGSYVGSTEKAKEAILYSYNRYINGFAAVLEEDEAAKIAKHPDVVSVFLSKRQKLHTTHSWDFLGLKSVFSHHPLPQKTLGEDVIIGNLDTGVWPESQSFSDKGLGPVPKRWRGICQTNAKIQDKFLCNRKLIGARYFSKGFEAGGSKLNASEVSARDFEGHGSHTLSTAGGSFVPGASVLGNGNGTASGGSPKARVATYKVCWTAGCADADILAGFEAAIGDGVDVISMSLGSDIPSEYFESGISIGSFHAAAHGITVVSSAGNSGPVSSTVSNTEPWVVTVAASTIDRDFSSYVTLGNKNIFKGESLSDNQLVSNKLYPLISGADAKLHNAPEIDALLCKEGALDPKKVKGKIIVCLRGETARLDKGVQAAHAGAVGMILANDEESANALVADPHLLPASAVNYANGSYIFKYINTTRSPVASISSVKTELRVKPAPVVASFSSRGPSFLEPAILKPDITAPGVNIIAAYSEAVSPTDLPSDKRKTPFMTLSGTSMSCPHVAGAVGLIKSVHRGWSPAAIKSAIITTATTTDNTGKAIQDSTSIGATPFDYGAGHIQPGLALHPGLLYDLNVTDYLNYLCDRGYNSSKLKLFFGKPYPCPKSFNLADFNYPTITTPKLKRGQYSLKFTRTVTNVGFPSTTTYTVNINAPPQVVVSVEPTKLSFKEKGEKKQFTVTLTLKLRSKPKTDYVYGSLVWTDGRHNVRSPIVVNVQR